MANTIITVIHKRELSVPSYGTYIDQYTLTSLVRDSGSHFFDPDTMRSFRSRLHDIVPGVDGWYFITSEKHEYHGGSYGVSANEPRKYTIRRLRINEDNTDLVLDDIDGFQAYSTLNRARTAAKRYAAAGVTLCPRCQRSPGHHESYCTVGKDGEQ
jgi:hypothetical protein